jgi:hypothetical protein
VKYPQANSEQEMREMMAKAKQLDQAHAAAEEEKRLLEEATKAAAAAAKVRRRLGCVHGRDI